MHNKALAQNRDFSSEAEFSASRSSGPGGQSVNKVNTKVELRLDIQKSILLSDKEKGRVYKKLCNRINNKGVLIITAQSERSQIGNKDKASKKLNQLIEKALIVEKRRIATRVPRSVIRKRLKNKKRTSDSKKTRKTPEVE